MSPRVFFTQLLPAPPTLFMYNTCFFPAIFVLFLFHLTLPSVRCSVMLLDGATTPLNLAITSVPPSSFPPPFSSLESCSPSSSPSFYCVACSLFGCHTPTLSLVVPCFVHSLSLLSSPLRFFFPPPLVHPPPSLLFSPPSP